MSTNIAMDRRELSFKAGAGLIGGAVGWLPVEITTHGRSITDPTTIGVAVASFVTWAILSGCIGGLINAADLQTLSWTPAVKRRCIVGFVVCFILGLIAMFPSDFVFGYFLELSGWGRGQQGSFGLLMLGRAAGWTLMGLLLGAGVGIASSSSNKAIKGALGGLIGGFIGGFFFDPITVLSGGGMLPRLVGLSVLGLAIGLFIGLVQELTKTAWLAVTEGRLRGRQFRLETAATMIGRAEENPVGLFGDTGVQARHAVIERRGTEYLIRNLAVQDGTRVNGSRVETAPLNEGDHIHIGNYELVFHLRPGAQAPRSAEQPVLQAAQAGGATIAVATPASSLRSSGAGAGPYLVGMSGERFPLRAAATIRVGRALDNDIVLNDGSVSRHHAALEVAQGRLKLRDLTSQNGTWVDGRRVSEAQMADGDSFRLGDAALTFHA
ncbi:MAG: FHA domain-containing protein [Candidatus Binataceae bacterium]